MKLTSSYLIATMVGSIAQLCQSFHFAGVPLSSKQVSQFLATENDGSMADESRRGTIIAIAAQLSMPIMVANSAVMENTQTVFKTGQPLTMDEAIARLKEGRKSIQYLLDHYDEISEGGGDNVRRYLGTVGTTSGLYGIGKVMNTLSERADDFVEYTEVSNEVLKSIQQADGSAYMAIFVTTSTSQTPPSKYFGDAKIEVKRCIKALDELAALVDVKY